MAIDDERARRRVLWLPLAAGAGASAAVCVALATQSVLVGSPAGRWYYGYSQALTVRVATVSMAMSAAAGVLALVTPRMTRAPWAALAVWMIVAAGGQAVVRGVAPVTLEQAFVSDSANAFYTASRQHRPGELLAHFSRVRAQLPTHAQSNMPGKILLLH